jgi:hypothetical protein
MTALAPTAAVSRCDETSSNDSHDTNTSPLAMPTADVSRCDETSSNDSHDLNTSPLAIQASSLAALGGESNLLAALTLINQALHVETKTYRWGDERLARSVGIKSHILREYRKTIVM